MGLPGECCFCRGGMYLFVSTFQARRVVVMTNNVTRYYFAKPFVIGGISGFLPNVWA